MPSGWKITSEDKIVQSALNKLLQRIYEQDFLDCSYGFRPQRSCHGALIQLDQIIDKQSIQFIVDADISGFFNHVDHEWLLKFLKLRIGDPNILHLIRRMLIAGVQEEGRLEPGKAQNKREEIQDQTQGFRELDETASP